MLKLGPALLKVTNALTSLTNERTNYWVRHKRALPIGADLIIDLKALDGINVRQIFDVGANRGQTYHRFRKDFPTATIHCFEPIDAPFAELVQATRGDANAHCEMLALGSAPGTTEVRLHDEADYLNSLRPDLMNQTSSARTQSVTIDTLDRYVTDRSISHIDLLKIDTEGFELAVIEGAQDCLSAGKISLVLAEVGFVRSDIRHTNFSDLTEVLYRYGLHFYGIYDIWHFRGNASTTNPWSGYANALYVAQPHVAMSAY